MSEALPPQSPTIPSVRMACRGPVIDREMKTLSSASVSYIYPFLNLNRLQDSRITPKSGQGPTPSLRVSQAAALSSARTATIRLRGGDEIRKLTRVSR